MKINILGSGLMGTQIASLFHIAGFEVSIWSHSNVDESKLNSQIKVLKKQFGIDKSSCPIKCYNKLSELPPAVTIESVKEDLNVKKHIYTFFKDIDYPYFTNSSSLAPNEIGENVNAIHFFNPINLKLVELFLHEENQKKQIAPMLDFLNEIDFEVIEVNPNRGYIGNFILFHEISSALKLMEVYKYPFADINKVYGKLYSGRNIFSIVDLIGIDVVYRILTNLKEIDPSIYLPNCLSIALEAGALGRKNRTSIVNYM